MGLMYRSSNTALHRVAVSYTESSPKNFSQFRQNFIVNARFYFHGPDLDVGPTYRSSHTALHRVAASHTESFPTNFGQFQ